MSTFNITQERTILPTFLPPSNLFITVLGNEMREYFVLRTQPELRVLETSPMKKAIYSLCHIHFSTQLSMGVSFPKLRTGE